jgi:hypothetical protein
MLESGYLDHWGRTWMKEPGRKEKSVGGIEVWKWEEKKKK